MQKLNKLTLKQREELFRQLRISITHHSNAMEGTTLSFGETKELLEHGNTAGDSICQGLQDTVDDEKYPIPLTGRRTKG